MKPKITILMIAAVAILALLLIAGCSKKAPAAAPPVAPVAQVTNQAPAPSVQTTAPAAAPVAAAPPELAQADQAVQDIGTSDLDQADRNIDTLAVP